MRWFMLVLVGMLVGCTEGEETGDSKVDGTEDTSGGGGEVDNWSASGNGYAYFADGVGDNTLFRLELSRATVPREGEAYYGFISAPGGELVPVGEITVNGEDVDFSYELDENGLELQYNHFEAWANSDGTASGDPVWTGDVDTTVFSVLERMLLSNPDTPTGEGSLRALESQLEFLIAQAEATQGAGLSDDEITLIAEKIGNGCENPYEDANNDGNEDAFDDSYPIQGEGDYAEDTFVTLIFNDLTAATEALSPTDPIRDYIEQVYDGVQLTSNAAPFCSSEAWGAARSGDASIAETKLDSAGEYLTLCLNGGDLNEDGVIDEQTEVGIEWSLSIASQMARMEVSAR